MKGMFSSGITSTSAFILSVLAILVIAVSAPGMAQAVTSPVATPPSSGDVQPGSAIQQSSYYGPKVNPAANFGSLTDNGTAAYMGVGIAVPVGPLHIYSTTSTQPETIDLSGAGPLTAQWNNWGPGGASSGTGFLARFSRGTKASPTDVQVGDRLGFNVFGGMVGGLFKHTAAIEAVVDSGAVSGTSLPTYMRFLTTPNGSTSRVERMRIDSAGRVGINTLTPDSISTLTSYSSAGNAIKGMTDTWNGVYGAASSSGTGVAGGSNTGMGVYGTSTSGVGIKGESSGSGSSGVGIYGKNLNAGGYAGYFEGNALVTETTTATKLIYSVARTHYYSIPGAEFTPASSFVQYSKGYGFGDAYITSNGNDLYAPVHLPDGAVVTGLRVYYYDNSSNDLVVNLEGQHLASGGYVIMASVTSSGSGYGNAIDNTINDATIDNTNYGYVIDARWAVPDTTNLSITSALITYTVSEAE